MRADLLEGAERFEARDSDGNFWFVIVVLVDVRSRGVQLDCKLLVGMRLDGERCAHGEHFEEEGQAQVEHRLPPLLLLAAPWLALPLSSRAWALRRRAHCIAQRMRRGTQRGGSWVWQIGLDQTGWVGPTRTTIDGLSLSHSYSGVTVRHGICSITIDGPFGCVPIHSSA